MGQIYKLISSQPFPLHLYKIYFSQVKNKWIFLDLAIFKNPKIQGRHRHCLFVSCDDTWGAEQKCQLFHDTRSHVYETHTTCLEAFMATSVNNILGWQLHQMVHSCVTSPASVLCYQNPDDTPVLKHCFIDNITWLSAPDDFTDNTHKTQHATFSHTKGTELCCTALYCAVLRCTALYCAEAESIWQLKQFYFRYAQTFIQTHALQTYMLKKAVQTCSTVHTVYTAYTVTAHCIDSDVSYWCLLHQLFHCLTLQIKTLCCRDQSCTWWQV